ncbi:MAG: 2-oxoacid:acceptor oxidoreductase family protein [Acidobacteriia bacterium]|nr:2-oxoacid:acceptor oxidoreductase family protein [Terriglobia bacterium]
MDRYEIRLSGEGGQGLVLAGAILAQAMGIHCGKHVAYTQSYGPESRGGGCRSDLVISDQPIDYPICSQLDLLLCLTQKACDKYWVQLKKGGLLIVDSTRVTRLPSGSFEVASVPILQTASVTLGREVVANMVCLGVIANLSGLIPREALQKALLERIPKGTEQINQRALEAGYGLTGALTPALTHAPLP